MQTEIRFDKNMKNIKFWHCLVMDCIGTITYFIPAIGETFDLVWAPISAVVFYYWFRKPIGSMIAMAEEILPFTDFIPTFSLAYLFFHRKELKC